MLTSRMHHRRMSTHMAIRIPTPNRTRTSTNICTVIILPILLRMYDRRLLKHLQAQV